MLGEGYRGSCRIDLSADFHCSAHEFVKLKRASIISSVNNSLKKSYGLFASSWAMVIKVMIVWSTGRLLEEPLRPDQPMFVHRPMTCFAMFYQYGTQKIWGGGLKSQNQKTYPVCTCNHTCILQRQKMHRLPGPDSRRWQRPLIATSSFHV